jgi:hypothetical protein
MTSNESIFHDYKDHNPLWRARAPVYLERREELFYTLKRRTPGLFSKASIVFTVFGMVYGMHILKRTRSEQDKLFMVNYEYKRKALPFLQAVEDRRYLVIEQRKKWLSEELFKNRHEEYLALSRLFHDPTAWVQPFTRTSIFLGGIPKTYKGLSRGLLDSLSGKDTYTKNTTDSHF